MLSYLPVVQRIRALGYGLRDGGSIPSGEATQGALVQWQNTRFICEVRRSDSSTRYRGQGRHSSQAGLISRPSRVQHRGRSQSQW